MKKHLLPVMILIFSIPLSAQWNNLNLTTSNALINCSFPSNDTGYVTSGKVFRTFDGGLTFDSVSVPTMAQYSSINFRTNTDGVVCGYVSPSGYGIFRTLNAGLNWQNITATNAVGAPLEVKFADAIHGTYITSTSGWYNTANGGITWDTMTYGFAMFNTIDYPTATTGYIGGFDGTFNYAGMIFKTTDAGVTWNVMPTSGQVNTTIKQIQFVNADTGFASFNNYAIPSQLIRTRDGALTWDTVNFYSGPIVRFAFSDYMNGFIVNDTGSIYRTNDAGVTWTLDRLWTTMINDVTVTPSFAYAVGNNGLIIKRNLQAGIPVEEYNTELKIYPNPGIDFVNLLLPHGTSIISITALDVTGKNCGTLPFSQSSSDELRIETRSLAKGCYILEIGDGKESFKVKFEKIR